LGILGKLGGMEKGQRFETQRMDHLGIVAEISREIELTQVIDEQVGPVGRKVSCGQAVQVMVLNALGLSSRALYRPPAASATWMTIHCRIGQYAVHPY